MVCETVWYSSAMQGAPTVSGTAGEGVALLDKILVNGFTALTLTSLTVASEVATATVSGGHAFLQWSVVEIAGCTPSGLNGRKRILTADATTFTFAATGLSDGSGTGTITAKIPGAGWTIDSSGTNTRLYRIDTVTGTGAYLSVDDTGTTDMRVYGCMASDLSDRFPTNTQAAGGLYLRKSSAASSTTRAWVAVADNRGVYIGVQTDGSTAYRASFFGDFVSYAAGAAPWDCAISAAASGSGTNGLGVTTGAAAGQVFYIPRLFSGVGTALAGTKKGFGDGSGYYGTYPSAVTGGIIAADTTLIHEGLSTTVIMEIRGKMPGHITFLNACGAALSFGSPVLISGLDSYVVAFQEAVASAPWFGVSLGDWR
jgi:hypothetical protein